LGALWSLTGPGAPEAVGTGQGITAAVDAQNAAGGVGGRQLVIVKADDQSSPVQAATAARGLVANNVFGIITEGFNDSPMYPFLQQNNVPVTEGNGLDTAYATDRNAFAAAGPVSATYTSTAAVDFLKQQGVTNLAVLNHGDPGSGASGNATVAAAKSIGMKVGLHLNDIPYTSADLTADALQMKRLGINGVYAPDTTEASISIATAIKQQGIQIKAMDLASVYDPSELKVSALTGAWTSASNYPLTVKVPAIQTYIANMAKYSPGTDPYTQFAILGYEAAQLMIYGLQQAGACPSRASFVNNLRNVDNYTENGLLLSPTSFKPGLTPMGSPVGLCSWFVQFGTNSFLAAPAKTCGTFIKVS
jgi:branched-chain amino acid transport system substrate-binding protein